MAQFKKYSLKSQADLQTELESLNLSLPTSDNIPILGETLDLGKWKLPNRFVVQPMEGIDADPVTSSPSELTFRRYRRFGQGGAGLIWFEAVVVVPEGKSNPKQLMITKDNLDVWKKLVKETRDAARDKWGHEIVLVLQISHSGRWSKPSGSPKPVIVHHNPTLDKSVKVDNRYPLITDSELDVLKDKFVETGLLATEAGFDGVEMKAVHGYLTGELLCAHTREGKYGGSYENRTRFVRECTKELKDKMGPDHFVTARLTMLEPSAYPFGWGVKAVEGSTDIDLAEPIKFAKELVELADMPLFNFSIGYPRSKPFMNRPFNSGVAGAPEPPEHPLEGIVRYQTISRELQTALGDTPVVTAALGWLRDLMPEVAAGLVEDGWAKLIGQGRGSFAYPDSVADILSSGKMDPKKCCVTCSLCSQMMKDVIGQNGCPIKDSEIYRPELKKGRDAAKAKGLA